MESPSFPLSTAGDIRRLHIFLVSDATGETLSSIAKAAMAQFPDIAALVHVSFMTRTRAQVERALSAASDAGGVVLYTLVNPELRAAMDEGSTRYKVPTINVLDPVIHALATYLGVPAKSVPGKQHALDAEYFKRIDAMNYTLTHDDGQHPQDLYEADVVILGVSRTSKTPTSIYLANRGLKTANIPVVPNLPLPEQLGELKTPLIVALTTSPDRLVQIRKHRLLTLGQHDKTDYIDQQAVETELLAARRLFARNGWPVIDVSRRSIEETAAAILNLYYDRLHLKNGVR